MGSPDWSRIPFDKMPQWKKDEILAQHKQEIQKIETTEEQKFICETCGKICKNKAGLFKHLTIHKTI